MAQANLRTFFEKCVRNTYLMRAYTILKTDDELENLQDIRNIHDFLHYEHYRSTFLASHDVRVEVWKGILTMCRLYSKDRNSLLEKLKLWNCNTWIKPTIFDEQLSRFAYRHLEAEEQMFGINEATENWYDAADSVKENCDTVKESIEELITEYKDLSSTWKQSGRDFSRTLQQMSGKWNTLMDTLSDKFSPSQSDPGSIFISRLTENWLPITMNIFKISKADSVMDIALSLYNIASLLGINSVAQTMLKNFNDSRPGQEQSFDNTKKLAALFLSSFGKFGPSSLLNIFTGKLTGISREIEAMDKIISVVEDTLLEWGFPVSDQARTVKLLQEKLTDALEKEAYYRGILSTKPSRFCEPKLFNSFEKRYETVVEMQKILNNSTFRALKDTNFVNSVNFLIVRYQGMRKTVMEIRNCTGKRVVPACYVLVGPSGCGKSVFVSSIRDLLHKRYEAKFFDNDDYACLDDIEQWTQWDQTVGDSYHEGYQSQEIHVVNEMFSAADDSDHSDLLRFISCDTFLTCQAALQDKGKPYNSRLIIGTANRIPSTSKTINNPEALHRRINVVMVNAKSNQMPVLPTPSDPLDVTKCKIDTEFNHLEFRIVDVADYFRLKSGNTPRHASSNVVYTADSLVDYIITDMAIKEHTFRSMRGDLQASEHRAYNDQNQVITCLGLPDLFAQLKQHDPIAFRNLRRLRPDPDSLLLADYMANKADDYVLEKLTDVQLPTIAPGTTFIIRGETHMWAYEGNELFRTDYSGEFAHPKANSEDFFENYCEEKFAFAAKSVLWYYKQCKAFEPWLAFARITAAFAKPLHFAYPYASGLIGMVVLLYRLYRTDDCPSGVETPPGQFWCTLYNGTAGLIALGFLGYIAYKAVTRTNELEIPATCADCTASVEAIYETLDANCETTCSKTCTSRCISMYMASRYRCNCQGDCPRTCLHSKLAWDDIDLTRGLIDLGHLVDDSQQEDSSRKANQRKVKMNRKAKPEYSVQGHNPGEKKKPTNVRTAMQEMMADLSALQVAKSLAKKSMVTLHSGQYVDGKFVVRGTLSGHGCGNYIFSPAHLHNSAANYDYVYERGNRKIPMTLLNKKPNRDIALWKIPDTENPFCTSIRSHLLTEEEMNRQMTKNRPALLYIPKSELIQVVQCTYRTSDAVRVSEKVIHYDRVFSVTGISFDAPLTQRGDCGGLLIAYDKTLQRKILGMHIVGTKADAISTILTLDELESMGMDCTTGSLENEEIIVEQPYSKFPIVDNQNLVDEEVELEGGKRRYLAPGDFAYLGEIEYNRPASATLLRKHPLYGTFPVLTRPAVTSEADLESTEGLVRNGYDEPDLLLTQVAKYGKRFQPLHEPELLKQMEDELVEYMVDELEEEDLGISEEAQILNGDPAEEASHSLDMRTSLGIPWSTKNPQGSKKISIMKTVIVKDEYGEREQYQLDDSNPTVQHLREIIVESEDYMSKGYRTLSIMKDCLKDEPRVIEKVERPRAFKSFPMEKLYLFRKYFLKFKTQWTKRNITFNHGVGVNPMSTDWAHLYSYLLSTSPVGCDGDFSRFDGNLRPDFMDTVSRIIIRVILGVHKRNGIPLPENYENVATILLDEITRSISCAKSTVYMDSHGNPSGSPLTTVTNCMVNFLYHWYAYARTSGFSSLASFQNKVSILTFGDDVVQTYAEDSPYNFDSIQEIMVNELGQDYTTANKTGTGSTVPISKLIFLKRKFVPMDGSPSIVLSPLDPAAIYQRFNWTHLRASEVASHVNVLGEALLEAVQHGSEFYNQFLAKLRSGIRELKLRREDDIASTRGRWFLQKSLRTTLINFSDARQQFLDRYN